MAIIPVLASWGAKLLASELVRGLGARLAFYTLHHLASKTDNDLDDNLVRLAEELYWGRRRPEWREEDE